MITNATNKVVYVSDGTQTEYYFNFVVYDASHIKVYTRKPNKLVSTLLDSTQYSVTLNSDYSGGKIILNSPLEADTEIAIIREVPLTQNMQYIEGDPFPAKSHERALDLLTMICQQLAEKISRALLQDIFDQQEVNITEFLGLLKYFQDNYDDYIKSFNEVYLGAKDAPPTTRNDGTPLQGGDLYFDTTKNGLYVWDGTQWVRISQETLVDDGLLKIWDENSQSFISSNADTVDNFHASQTPTANTIPVLDANAVLDLSTTFVKSNVYTFRRVDLTNATEDYELQVGEEAYIEFTDATSVPLHIATQDGTYYELDLIPSNQGGNTGGVSSGNYLLPNNTSYTGQFAVANVWRHKADFNSCYNTDDDSFYLGHAILSGKIYIVNRTVYKNVKCFIANYGRDIDWPALQIIVVDWRDTTTEWTSLGTITFSQSTSGVILVRRLK